MSDYIPKKHLNVLRKPSILPKEARKKIGIGLKKSNAVVGSSQHEKIKIKLAF